MKLQKIKETAYELGFVFWSWFWIGIFAIIANPISLKFIDDIKIKANAVKLEIFETYDDIEEPTALDKLNLNLKIKIYNGIATEYNQKSLFYQTNLKKLPDWV